MSENEGGALFHGVGSQTYYSAQQSRRFETSNNNAAKTPTLPNVVVNQSAESRSCFAQELCS